MPRKTKIKKKVPAKARLVIREEGGSYGSREPVFLTLAQVLKSHTRQLEQFGGTDGVRDMALLESAMSQPESAFSGHWLHADLFEMAAAYAFHLCKNHPFLDGNKRTALDAALIFLESNGVSILANKALLGVMLSVAEGKMNKKELAQVFRNLPKE
ncbi:MAG: type II toxin-antitoxin system death-on-curing family toxin [Candidatus Omnitrophota bacterium]